MAQAHGEAMRIRIISGVLAGAAGLLILPDMASAQSQAYTTSPVNLYAGPAQDYPVVSQLPAGVPVAVMGCVSGYTWCDVGVQDQRGWVYAGYLNYPYQGNNVPLLNYGTAIGLPIVTFSIGTYWGSYYRGRPWYNNQAHWEHHAPPPPGPPPGHGGPPPGHGGPPPGHGGPPAGHGGPPQEHGGPPAGHGGPPQEHGGLPPGHGGSSQEHGGPPPGHGGPPQGHGEPPQQHGGPPPEHSGGPPPSNNSARGGGGGNNSARGGNEEHHN
jgi:uncharacterized protein YraI